MRVAFDPCCRCKEEVETVPHLFYTCKDCQTRWTLLHELASKARASFQNMHGLLETIDEALRTKKKEGPPIYILYTITSAIWKDRNHIFFRGQPQLTPLQVSLEQARLQIENSFNNQSSISHWQLGLEALEEINSLLAVLAPLAVNSTRSNEYAGERTQSAMTPLLQKSHRGDKFFAGCHGSSDNRIHKKKCRQWGESSIK
ncbi:hypothetical protein R1flu_028914 [Riccia fluitans]|uniref:Uncharacterized protein n=1 Tax=Riccia fluitans TaxID=41844 RepID=A0ABD1XN27_9MARC